MILIKPIAIDNSKLASSIPEPDTAQGEQDWSAGTYNLGDRAVDGDSIYEVVADPSTTDQPTVGITKTPATWVYVSPTNRFKMFDQANNTQTVGDNIDVEVSPTELVNSVSGFNLSCENITITVYDGSDSVVYTRDISMRSRPLVNGWYNYYYTLFEITSKFVLLDLPPTTVGKVRAQFFGDNAKVGTFIVGRQVQMGDAQYGTGAQLLDFSNPIEDEFGNLSYSDGFTAKLVDFDILADTPSIDSIFTEIQRLGKSPAVFVGNTNTLGDSTLVYGYVRDFNPVYTWPTKSKISLTVRGLV